MDREKDFTEYKVIVPLKKINSMLLVLLLISLVYRKGSLSFGTINPFEIIFVLLSISTLVQLFIEKRIQELTSLLPKKIVIALCCLLGSILLGWVIAVQVNDVPTTTNMFFEFGAFIVAVGIFLLVTFHVKDDHRYQTICLYALSTTAFFAIFITWPRLAYRLDLARDGTLSGLTSNVNIFSKMMLIPAILFASYALFKKSYIKLLYILAASSSVTILLWTAERGAILSLAVGLLTVGGVYFFSNLKWKTFFSITGTFLLIVLLGFSMAPHITKKVILDRSLNLDKEQSGYEGVKNKSIRDIVQGSVVKKETIADVVPDPHSAADSRFKIWPYYLGFSLQHPIGIGPNTHMDAQIPYRNRMFINPGPHNTYLQILLWGGVIGLLSFIFIIWSAFKNITLTLIKSIDPVSIALFGILTALSVAIIFNDSLQFYWYWIILALCIIRK